MDNKTTITFAQALAAHLESRGLTQRHLALMLDVTDGMVSNYLAGRREPGARLIQRLGDVLEARVRYRPGKGWRFKVKC